MTRRNGDQRKGVIKTAERRMFTKKVTDDDSFMELSASAQALYLHLSMSADDDGFCNQVNLSMFKAHASVQDLEALLEKRYLIQFETGVIVIRHWRMANALRKDRYTETIFKEEMSHLDIAPSGVYEWLPNGCQMVANRLPQDRLEEDRLVKDSKEEKKGRFKPPTVEEVSAYLTEKGYDIDPEAFVDFYASKGWKVGNSPMKDWKAAVGTWVRRRKNDNPAPKKTGNNGPVQQNNPFNSFEQHRYSDDELDALEKMLIQN